MHATTKGQLDASLVQSSRDRRQAPADLDEHGAQDVPAHDIGPIAAVVKGPGDNVLGVDEAVLQELVKDDEHELVVEAPKGGHGSQEGDAVGRGGDEAPEDADISVRAPRE